MLTMNEGFDRSGPSPLTIRDGCTSAFIRLEGVFVRPDGTILELSSTKTVTLYDAHAALFSAEFGKSTTSISLMTSLTRPMQGPVPPGSLLFPNVFIISVGLQAFAIAGGLAGASASVFTQVNECCGSSE